MGVAPVIIQLLDWDFGTSLPQGMRNSSRRTREPGKPGKPEPNGVPHASQVAGSSMFKSNNK